MVCQVCLCQQLLLQPLALPGGKFKRPSPGGDRFQGRPAAELDVMLPAAHAARIDIQAARNLGLSQPLLQQPDGMFTFPLQLVWTALRPDKSPPHNHHRIGHYLYRRQRPPRKTRIADKPFAGSKINSIVTQEPGVLYMPPHCMSG